MWALVKLKQVLDITEERQTSNEEKSQEMLRQIFFL